jgi:S-adenosylmethionine hydrolase
MTNAINSYLYARNEQKLPPIDACADAAQFHGVDVYALATALRAAGIDVARLSII